MVGLPSWGRRRLLHGARDIQDEELVGAGQGLSLDGEEEGFADSARVGLFPPPAEDCAFLPLSSTMRPGSRNAATTAGRELTSLWSMGTKE
jgi:hypothetical protein